MLTSMPATPPPDAGRERPRATNRVWSRRLLLLAMAVAACLAAGIVLLAVLRPDRPTAQTFAVQVVLRGARGRFDAVTTNLSDRSRRPGCKVSAFDIYGRTIGSEAFELGELSAGTSLDWDGRLEVDGRVERMTIECR